jgi:DNA ligase-1
VLHQAIKPMLLYASPEVPQGSEYIHQLKWDGHRALLHMGDGNRSCYTRHQNPCIDRYPELQSVTVRAKEVILDGEMIVLGDDGKPCFESIMERFSSRKSAWRLANKLPAHFVAFDILYMDGHAVTHLPLERRLELLEEVLVPSDIISVCPSIEDGEALFQAVKHQGLEGIVSKKKQSSYTIDKRSKSWLKTKAYLFEKGVQIAGIRRGEFGWLLQKDERYVGVLEFAPPAARQAFARISNQIVTHETKDYTFVKPLIRCTVKFQSYTKKGLMRSPTFVQFETGT